jgi:hypothetical protein
MTFRYYSDEITIEVGLGKYARDFTICKDLICETSDFIENALKKNWRSSEDQVVKLPDFSSEDFEIYHVWVLSGRLYSRDGDKWHAESLDLDKPESLQEYKESLWSEMVKLGKLSHLGHYLLDSYFTDTVSDAMVQCMVELQAGKCAFPSADGPDMIAKLPESSPTRKLIFDLVAWTTDEAEMRDICAALREHSTVEEHLDFMTGVSVAMASIRTPSTPNPTSPLDAWDLLDTAMSCKYHSHGKEKGCYRNRIY